MEEGSRAKEFILSFPPTGENYPKAIEEIKARFAKDEVLIEYYVRELIQIVISQMKAGSRMTIGNLYDKLMAQVLALESMGVTKDKYALILYPIIESALPEEIVRAWNRSRDRYGHSGTNLTNLLEFIRIEVESESKINISRFGFSTTEFASVPYNATANFFTKTIKDGMQLKENIKMENKRQKNCIWCDKVHPSSECYKAQNMKLEERKEHLKNKRACFRCLNIGHCYYMCKRLLKCLICSRRHFTIMCPNEKEIPTLNELGWTIQGPTTDIQVGTANLNTTMISFDVNGLSSSELVGTRDEASVKSHKKHQEKVEIVFKPNICINRKRIYNCRNKNSMKRNKAFTATEYIEAERKMCLSIQRENFRDIEEVKKKTRLDIFSDADGIPRVRIKK